MEIQKAEYSKLVEPGTWRRQGNPLTRFPFTCPRSFIFTRNSRSQPPRFGNARQFEIVRSQPHADQTCFSNPL